MDDNRMGRPVRRTEPYRRTTIDIPESLMQFLKTKPSRTAWIIEAIQEKKERELYTVRQADEEFERSLTIPPSPYLIEE